MLPVRRLKKDMTASDELERRARTEIQEQQPATRIEREVAERIEEEIPAIIGKQKTPVVFDPDKAREASPMRHVQTLAPRNARCG